MIRYDYDPAGSRFGANIRLSSYLANPLSVRSLGLAPAQHHIRVGPVLRIEKRIAANRDLGIGFGNLTELHTNVALAHVRAHGSREHASADLESTQKTK